MSLFSRFLALFISVTPLANPSDLNPIRANFTEPNGSFTAQHQAVGELYWESYYNCNAILVSAKVALTAQHCVDHWTPSTYHKATIVFGNNEYKVKKVVPFFVFMTPGATDVASIELTEGVYGIRPIRIAATSPLDGDSLVFVGRGCSPYLSLKYGAPVLPTGFKRHIFFTLKGAMDYEFLISDEFRMCPGDSGGALIRLRDYALVGIGSAKIYTVRDGKESYVASAFGDPKLFLNLLGNGRVYTDLHTLLNPLLRNLR